MVFGFGKPHFLGIDFGAASIKAVEFSVENNQPTLINYAQISLADVERKKISKEEYSYDNAITEYLIALLKKMNPKSDAAYVAMPAFTGLTFFVEFPVMEEVDLENAIRFEAHKYIPSSLEDVALSWEVVNIHSTSEGEKMGVLLVAALNKDVARFEKYVTGAKMGLGFLELETFSLARSIVGDELGLFFIIDIGSQATNILLIDDGVVKASRNIDVGGKDITHTLEESFGITLERAEIMKKSGKDFFVSSESTLTFPSLQVIASEVGRMYSSYQTKHIGVECKQVFLSGGAARFTGLAKYYSDILKMPVSMGDPWRTVKYNPLLKKKVEELGTSFSVAVGLALRGTDSLLNKRVKLIKKSKGNFSLKEMFTKKL
jgi:type IV pilus assembly protein PilM